MPCARLSSLLVLAAAVLFTAVPVAEQEAHRAILAGKLRTELDRIAREVPGVLGASVVDLTSGEHFGVNDTLTFPQGSAIKVPVLVELYRQAHAGRLRLDERLPVRRADQVAGTGVLQHFGDGGSAVALRDLAALMIVLSDNTATNLLIERVGMERVNASMRELGLPGTRLQRLMIRPRESARGQENLSTPAEAARLMARIARCELPVGADGCAELRRILEIPKEGAIPAALPVGVRVAWKPGGVTGVGTAWGLVELPGRPYALAVMVNYSDGGAADEAIRRVTAASHAYFSRLAGATPHGARVDPALLRETARGPAATP